MKPLHLLLGAGALFLGYQALKKPKRSSSDSDDGFVGPPPPDNGNGNGNGTGPEPGPPLPHHKILAWNDMIAQEVQAKAEEIYAALPADQQAASPARFFVLARDTVMAVWPNETKWPKTTNDLVLVPPPEGVPVPEGYGGNDWPRWVVQAGAKGAIMSKIFDETFKISQDIYGYVPPGT